MQRRSLTRGASVMVVSVAVAKVLGILYIVPLTSLIHREGLGIYSNAYALYAILLTLATSGFPTAMGKVVSERLALHRYAEVEQIYRVTMRALWLFAFILAVAMWFGAPLYSHLVALRDPSGASRYLVLTIRALAPSVLIVPAMSGLRGYLQGFQRLEPSGYSQAVEQFFRVLAMVVGAAIVMRVTHNNISDGAAAATFGAFIGALAGMALLQLAVTRLRREFRRERRASKAARHSGLTNAQVLRSLFHVGLPISLAALVVPISNLVDSVTVQNLLMVSGENLRTATAQYGILSRQAFQLVQLPLAFGMAVGASVLPSISHAKAVNDQQTIERNVVGTIRSMFFMSFPIAASLLMLGRPVDILLFGGTEGALIISGVSFMGILSSLELISTYMLQGLGSLMRPVRNMFIGVTIKLILNLTLIPHYHIMGAAVATTVGYLFSSMLNILAVRKYGHLKFSVWRLSGPMIAAAIPLCLTLGGVSFVAYHAAHALYGGADRFVALTQIVLALLVGTVVYVVAAIVMRAVSAAELKRLPVVGSRLSRLAGQLQSSRTAV
ncbi:putative polysaccharide biosynthesis protein [Alicyclobacillus sp. ALC3]|uniref:putative polysaccharide biosynthesis protein n=1 Tax=Alicyclobacillus sp. ALC3 TaxID=2796143 RepID=UPI00237917D8|nr:polysaccharide biosynthesis protein [Alicyclobacillus sp. ALC3]WDL99018.1 polysaccharide biosynthesis protein [Alicyclobacillus sp. ALC3]